MLSYKTIQILQKIVHSQKRVDERRLKEVRNDLAELKVDSDYYTTLNLTRECNEYFFNIMDFETVLEELDEELTAIRYRAEESKED